MFSTFGHWNKICSTLASISQSYISTFSKAFKSIPHSYLIKKLECYALSESVLKLLSSYLQNGLKRVKIGNKYSTWEHIKCGVPQGSILGPDLFNIFINDMFYVLEQSTLYNYADDNIVSYTNDEEEELLTCLESDLSNWMSWFKTNCLGVNRGNRQCMFISNDSNNTINVNIDNTVPLPE